MQFFGNFDLYFGIAEVFPPNFIIIFAVIDNTTYFEKKTHEYFFKAIFPLLNNARSFEYEPDEII